MRKQDIKLYLRANFLKFILKFIGPALLHSGTAFTPHVGVRGSIPGRDRPK